ncbi:TetR/AcrR family transcriptional regulator [Agromyces sp. NPDC056523]|uniref:TetR/AcrR family transcriptional regulator n=1 Tax=Agromyces sp. NPDC056523 TaxID=3345850 RepID=UPI00366FD048
MVTGASARHLESTRSVILSASADLFLAREGASFSVQEVADRAGVTHRTVYRHFPTRADLLIATAREIGSDLGTDEEPPSDVDEWIAAAGRRFVLVESRIRVLRGVSAAIFAAEDDPVGAPPTPQDDARWPLFRGEFAHLDESEAIRAFAGLRHVLSSVSYFFLRTRFGMSPEEASAALCETATRVVEGLRNPSQR